MRRILVPLDGTDQAASILPDARRLAGSGGTLILVRDLHGPARNLAGAGHEQLTSIETYLDDIRNTLREQGVTVEIHPMTQGDAAVAIDDAALLFKADMIALATHGESAAEHWQHGSIAWRALLRSTVPVLIRHVDSNQVVAGETGPAQRRLLVPLDGSRLAEKALPLADRLATEWGASLWLLHVITDSEEHGSPLEGEEGATAYLDQIARNLSTHATIEVRRGRAVETVITVVRTLGITDIVMTTHGRTGLTRSLVGTVADELIHQLHRPIVVIPALAALAP